jgi:hypothetical protein
MITMDDKFLYQLRENPDTVFVENLQKKLASYQSTPDKKWNIALRPFTGNKTANLIWITASIIMVLLIAMTVTPVRAFILAIPIEIAGRIFETTDDYPGNDTDDVKIIKPKTMSLDEALTSFPYAVKLPSNVPLEYVMDEEHVRVYLGIENWSNLIELAWLGEGTGFELAICGNCEFERGEIIAPDAVEEVLLDNQHPAALIRGGWYQNENAWNYNIALTLEWQVDNILYRLSSGTLTVEQLIEIANSTIEK